jgi:hypothetical protein
VFWNTALAQDNVEIPTSTGTGATESPAPAPIRLQDYGKPVRFRNIWILPVGGPPASPVTLLSTGSTWKYLDNGSNQGTNWIQNGFNDGNWPSGPAMLGYGDANGIFPRTTNSFGSDSNNKYISTYFRRTFVLSNTWGLTHLTARLQRDDGAIGYLNGLEVFRSNMPTGAVSYTSLASSAVANKNETRFYLNAVDCAALRSGTNVLAVEIHQSSTNSSDIAFDLALEAERLRPPSLNISVGGNGLHLSWPASADGLNLDVATNLYLPVVWDSDTNSPVVSNGLRNVFCPIPPNGHRFYRLRSP